MFSRAVHDTFRFYRRAWWRLALLQLATGTALAASVLVITGVASLLIGANVVDLSTGGVPDRGPIAAVLFAVIALMVLVGLPVIAAGLVATVWLVDDTLAGRAPRTTRAFFVSFTRAWPTTASTVLLVATSLLLVALSPLISVVGILGLAATGVLALARRRTAGLLPRWPSARTFVWAAVPFAVALRWIITGAFFIPAAALDGLGPVAALRAGGQLLAGRLVASMAVVAAVVATGLASQIAITSLGSMLGGGGGANTGTLIGQVVAQSVLVALPLVVLTVLFRLAQATPAGEKPPTSATAPYATGTAWAPKKTFRPALAPLGIRRTALLMPFVLLLAAFVTPVAGAQAATAPASIVVTTAADTVDADVLAAQQQNCADGSGDCSLRAALTQAQALATSGASAAVAITFGADYVIAVTPGHPLRFDTDSGPVGETPPGETPPGETPPGETQPGETPPGENQPGEGGGATPGVLSISGAGHSVVLDGQKATAVLEFSSRSWGLALFNLQISNGVSGSSQTGGGLSLFSPSSASRIDSVTFDHNSAESGGGAVYSNSRLAVVNSTFSDNSVGEVLNVLPGGADLYNSGPLMAVNNSTFSGPVGGSIFNFGAGSNYATTLDNSVFVNTDPGTFNCTNGGSTGTITGANNVVSGGEASCPGTVPNTGPSLRPLAATADNTPPVHVLAASTPGNPVNAAIGAGGLGAGAVACEPVDQRGVARPASGCAAGAVEYSSATRVALTSSANPENFGNAVSFTARVTAVDGGSPVSAGSVRFLVDGTAVGAAVALNSDGLAAFSSATLAVGTRAMTAQFVSSLPQSYSDAATTAPLNQVIEESPITVTLASSQSPSRVGAPVTLSVSVASRLSLASPTGTVTITDITGGQSVVVAKDLPLAALNASGGATVTTSDLGVGRRTLVARYSGDADFPAATSAEYAQVVQVASTVEASVDTPDAAFGTPVTVSVRVPTSNAGVVPSGTVVVEYAGVSGPVGTRVTLDATGAATLTVADLSASATGITARYYGDDVYAAAVSAPVDVAPAAATTRAILAASATGPVAFGTPVTLTATVRTTASGSERPPAGTVVFTVGGASIGSAAVVPAGELSAVATLVPTADQLPVGDTAVVARFVPDRATEFVGDSSTAATVSVTRAVPAVVLTSSANPAVTGQPVALTAVVAPPVGTSGLPAGTVVFQRDGTEIGRATLDAASATLTVSTLALGSGSITAVYSGSASFESRTSGAVTQKVQAASVTTRLEITPGSTSRYGTKLDLRATAAVVAPGGGTPTGSIVVREGSNVVATIPLAGGSGTATVVSPRVGDHEYVASYVPATGDYLASSTTVPYSVTSSNTALSLSASASRTVYGVPVTFAATVSNTSNGPTPEGTVTFTVDGQAAGTAAVVDGVATLTTALPSGYRASDSAVSVYAMFSADEGFNPSGAGESIVVERGTVGVTVAVGPSATDAPTTITATVAATTGSGPVTGYVQFDSRGTSLGSAQVVDGKASVSTVSFVPGRNFVTATFVGTNPNFAPADVASQPFDTVKGAPVPRLTGTATGPVVYGTAETLTVVIPTAGPMPTGTVTVTAVGTGGTRELATVALTGAAVTGTTVTASVLVPAGSQNVTARYNGDNTYAPATSAALARTVTTAATQLEVYGFATADSSSTGIVGEPHTLVARVTNTATSPDPVGVVAFYRGDVELDSARVTSFGRYGQATMQYTPAAKGTLDVRAVFTPDSGDFAAARGDGSVPVAGRPVTLTVGFPTGSPSYVAAGDPFTLVAIATDAAGNSGSTRSTVAGTVTMSDADGNSCVATLALTAGTRESRGECRITLPKAGSSKITATYDGDPVFAATKSTFAVDVITYATRLTLTSSSATQKWVAGDKVTLDWTVSSAEAGGPVTLRQGDTVVCRSTKLSGSCDFTFPTSSANQTFTLDYAGLGKFAAATTSVSARVHSCIPLGTLSASPAGSGFVGTYSQPDCNNGAGFVSGSRIGLFASAKPGYNFSSWEGAAEDFPRTSVVVPETGSIDQIAYFTSVCVTVKVTAYVAYELRDTNPGSVIVSPAPNCGTGWTKTDRMTRSASYAVGTDVALRAVAPALPASAAPHVLYSWSGLGTLAAPLDLNQKYRVVSDEDGGNDIAADFGVKCYHNISFAASALGTAEMTAPNCQDASGPGFAAKSTVTVSTKALGDAYFRGWSSNVTEVATGSNGKSGKGTIYVEERRDLPVVANFGTCVSFSATTTGERYDARERKIVPWGTAVVTPSGTCPSKGDGWYTTGTNVTVTTAWSDYDAALQGFTGEYAAQLDPTRKSNTITLDRSGSVTAAFYSKLKCVPVGLTVVPAGSATAAATVAGNNGCPAGMLNYDVGDANSGETLLLTAKATSGDPLLGWSGSTRRPTMDGLSVPVTVKAARDSPFSLRAYGETSFTAWACQIVAPTVTLISPNGTPHSTPGTIGGQFVAAATTPDCPIAGNAYTVDQPVFLRAPGESTGYTFTGWSGAVTGTSIAPKTPVIVDGASKTLAVTATYQVHCFTLTTNRNELRTNIEPNCPDTPASQGKYIGGTQVSFEATGSGDAHFRGFTGAPDGQDGTLAWVTVDSDVAVYANYESRSVGEKIVDGFVSLGNNIAIGAKKAVGVASAVAGAFLVGDNPVMLAANLVVLLGQAVQAIADQFGLSSAGLASFTAGIKHLSQTLDMINSTTTCTTAWAMASNAAAAPTVKSATAAKIGTVMTDKINAAQKAVDAKRQAEIYEQMVTVTMFKDAKAATAVADAGQSTVSSTQRAISYLATKGTAAADAAKEVAEKLKGPMQKAGQLGDVAMIGYKLYSDIDSGAAGWDADAESAWTKGQDVFMNCMTNSIPDYMGVPKTS